MLGVNEAACLCQKGPGPSNGALQCSVSLSLASAGLFFFLPPCNRQLRSHTYTSGVRGERGGGGVHRKTVSGSGLSFHCNLSFFFLLYYSLVYISSLAALWGQVHVARWLRLIIICTINQQSNHGTYLFANLIYFSFSYLFVQPKHF